MMYAAASTTSWRSYLRTQRGLHKADLDYAFDSRYDWLRPTSLLEPLGVSLDRASQSVEQNLCFETARIAFLDGAHGRALAALSAALEKESDQDRRVNFRTPFLRGALRLGSPDFTEPSAIDAAGAWNDLKEAVIRADAVFQQDSSEKNRQALAICKFVSAWAAFCAGSPRAALDETEAASALWPKLLPAQYLEAKAAAALGKGKRAVATLHTVIKLDPGFAAIAAKDADFATEPLIALRDSLFARLSESAAAARLRLEEIRKPAAAAIEFIELETAIAPAPPEFFAPPPIPNERAPLAIQIAAVRLTRQAQMAALHEVSDALTRERPASELRRKAMSDRLRSELSSAQTVGLGGALFGAVAGALAIAGVTEAMQDSPLQGQLEFSAAMLGASTLLALVFGYGMWRWAMRSGPARNASLRLRAALAHCSKLSSASAAIEEALGAMGRLGADPRFQEIWAKPIEPKRLTPAANTKNPSLFGEEKAEHASAKEPESQAA